MARIVRAQVALEVGQSLRDLSGRVRKLSEFTGEAHTMQLISIRNSLHIQVSRLDSLIESCRQARNSYPNYPSLRRAITIAGDQAYEIKNQLELLQSSFVGAPEEAVTLLRLGQELRLLSFVAPDRSSKEAV